MIMNKKKNTGRKLRDVSMAQFMLISKSFRLLVIGALLPLFLMSDCFADVNLAVNALVTASSTRDGSVVEAIVDGVVADRSRWLAKEGDQAPWIELGFAKPLSIAVIDVYTGWEASQATEEFHLELKIGDDWLTPKGGKVSENAEQVYRIESKHVEVSAVRLSLPSGDAGRIREIAIYENPVAMIGVGLKGVTQPEKKIDFKQHQIGLNQVGFSNERPKRFTAPLSADETHFVLRKSEGTEILFRGKIEGGIGDFSSFIGKESGQHYVIEVRGGDLKVGVSDPFLVEDGLFKKEFWQPAVDFLNDGRSVVGTHPSAFGGSPWRDGTYYDAIIPALVTFYLSDQKLVESMPRQIDWHAEKKRVTSPEFKFDANNPGAGGVMDAVRNYYELEPPADDAPDVVKLIHWGAGYYLVNPATQDPSGVPEGRKIHAQTVEQVSYVVWAWPVLKQWLPQSFYEKCRDFCFENWEPSLAINKFWSMDTYLDIDDKSQSMGGFLHPYKGRHAPGHSIVPNLMMHEVAQREGRKDAAIYLDAAVKQADWIIKNLDWNDPRTTKGQRMSEHRTIPSLVWMLQNYPEQAPKGLKQKITEWAKVAVSRSENMWDFRRYDLEKHWTIPQLNDVGNSLSLPAIAISASWVVDEPALKKRLEMLAVASVDHVFGRNPKLAAAPSDPSMGFPEIERGWPFHYHTNVCARLELVRGSISSLPGSEMYPFNPSGKPRHPEGWVNYGASWCTSLAYLSFDAAGKTSPSLSKIKAAEGGKEVE